MVYLLTFNCYGIHLRGDENGSVDRPRKDRGGPIPPSPKLVSYAKRAMTHAEASLTFEETAVVLRAIQEVCEFRQWFLLAAHVRGTHVHLVVDGIRETTDAMRDFKSYASRALNRDRGVRRRWSRGGNARPLPNSRAVDAAINYVAHGQGQAMALYVASPRTASHGYRCAFP